MSTVTPTFGELFFSYCYTCFVSLVVAESLQVFITASAIRFLCSSSQPLHNAGKLRQSVGCKYRADEINKIKKSILLKAFFFGKKIMKMRLHIMTTCVRMKTYHDELLCFILNIQVLLVCCQNVQVTLLWGGGLGVFSKVSVKRLLKC